MWILSVQLWYFHKIINTPNRPTSILKIIICYKKSSKKLSLGIDICSYYLIGSFQNFLKEILTHNFLVIEIGLNIFFICTLEMVVGLR